MLQLIIYVAVPVVAFDFDLILIVWMGYDPGILFRIIMMGRAVKLAKFVAKLKGKEELLRGGC